MNFDDLHTFIVVAENRSFSHAALQLHVSQPCISKRVAALEESLQVKLLDRVGRKVTLTEAGSTLLARARGILANVEDSLRAIANLSGTVSGRLSIGTSHHIGLHHLPPVLRSYVAQFPHVALDLHFMDSETACQSVLKGELELGIVTLPPAPLENLQLTCVWDDPLTFVCATHHALAHCGHVTPKQLSAHPAILPGRGTYTRQIFETAIQPFDVPIQVSLETNYLETIKMMISVGLGWGILPISMLDKSLQPFDVVQVSTMRRSLGVVRHVDRTLSNAAGEMIRLLGNIGGDAKSSLRKYGQRHG